MNKKYKLAFIGGSCESIAGYPHFIACRMDERFEVVAGAFSTHDDINKRSGEAWGVPRVYSNWRDLLVEERGKVDAVLILLPTPLHCEVVCQSLELDYPVICEKPLSSSIDEMEMIRRVYDPKKHYLAVINNYSGYPMIRELRERISSGELGEIHVVRLEMPQESFLRPPKSIKYPQKWRLKDDYIPMIALDLGTHLYHLAEFLLQSKPNEVWGEMNSFSSYPVVDDVVIQARFPQKTRGSFWMSKVALGNRNGLTVKVYGSKGSATWLQERPERVEIAKGDGSKCIIDRGGELLTSNHLYNRMTPGHPAGFIEALANLYSDLNSSLESFFKKESDLNSYVYGFEHAYEAMKFLHNAKSSSIRGEWVENR